MDRSRRQPGEAFAVEAQGPLPARVVRALWWGSAGLVLAVLGTAVVVAGAGDGRRLSVAAALVLVQVGALRWQVRIPLVVLAVTAVTGLTVWALLPEVSLTGRCSRRRSCCACCRPPARGRCQCGRSP